MTTYVLEQPDGTFTTSLGGQLTSTDGERVAPVGVVLHESWTAAERAEFGVYAAQDTEVPEGKVVVSSHYERQGGDVVQVLELEDAPVVVPESVTPRQLRLALLGAGKLAQINAFVTSGAVPEAARISWEYATEYRRDDPLLNQMAGLLDPPLSQAQIDGLFIQASQIQ